MKRGGNRGQIDLSFGFIFSVILIAVFLGFAIYAITIFLGMKSKIETGKFIDDLQADITKLWKLDYGTDVFNYFLPTKIKEVCFIDKDSPERGARKEIYRELSRNARSGENLVFYPVGSSKVENAFEIKYLDISKITESENPYCIQNKNGKATLTLEQDYGGSPFVSIRR